MSDLSVQGETAGPSHEVGHESAGGTSHAGQFDVLAQELHEMKRHQEVAEGECTSCKGLAGLRAGVVFASQLTSPRDRGLPFPGWGLRRGARLPLLSLVGLPPFLPRSPSQLAPSVLLEEAGRAGWGVAPRGRPPNSRNFCSEPSGTPLKLAPAGHAPGVKGWGPGQCFG